MYKISAVDNKISAVCHEDRKISKIRLIQRNCERKYTWYFHQYKNYLYLHAYFLILEGILENFPMILEKLKLWQSIIRENQIAADAAAEWSSLKIAVCRFCKYKESWLIILAKSLKKICELKHFDGCFCLEDIEVSSIFGYSCCGKCAPCKSD